MTEKDIFEVVKYFKSIYSVLNINIQDDIYISGNGDHINIYYKPNKFFLIYGKIKNVKSNEFLNWISGKNILLNISSIFELKECLKKNVISLEKDNNNFNIKYRDKNNLEKNFICSNLNDTPIEFNNLINKIILLNKEFGKELLLDSSLFKNEITELYYSGSSDLNENTDQLDKIFELPSRRILSLLKDATTYSMRITDETTMDTKKFIEISSSNDLIKLSQIFAII
jgi:hypothetical protein